VQGGTRNKMAEHRFIIDSTARILVTGAGGFIGHRVVQSLRRLGFTKLRCLVRKPCHVSALGITRDVPGIDDLEILVGDLASRDDCRKAVSGTSLIYHLAAGMGRSRDRIEVDSVAATRNLLEEAAKDENVRRFALVSSFAVYDTSQLKAGAVLDERCPVEGGLQGGLDPYSYGKVRQEQLLRGYRTDERLRYTIVRPGVVYGPGMKEMSGRVGIRRLGLFLHFGGANLLPLTYVENCADAIALAGLVGGVDQEAFNLVDDDLISSAEFLRLYKANVEPLRSVYVPRIASYMLCYLGEKIVRWSSARSALPLSRKRWSNDWKGHRYSNEKAKRLLGWKPAVSMNEGLERYHQYCNMESSEWSA